MKYINLYQGGHRETYNYEIKKLSTKIEIKYMPKNFTNFCKLIFEKELIFFSCCSDGRLYILFISLFRILLNNKTKVLDFTKFSEISIKNILYNLYLFSLKRLVTLISISSMGTSHKYSLVDLCFLNLNGPVKNKFHYCLGYFGSISNHKNFEGFVSALNTNIFQKGIICSYNFQEKHLSHLKDRSKVTIIDETLEFNELIEKISQTEYIWTAYDYNQTSGIFGICYQLGSKAIIMKDKYLEKLNYKNSYYLDNEKIHKCAKNGNEFYLNIDVEKRKWKEIFN